MIIHTDCISAMREMEDNSVDHVFTSPPYNRKRNDKYNFYNDQVVDWEGLINEVIQQSLRISKGFLFLNLQANYYNRAEVLRIGGEWASSIVNIIVWSKTNPMPASGLNITNAYEFIFVISNKQKSLKGNHTYTKNMFTTNAYTDNKYTKIHRAVMHPEAARFIIGNFTKEQELILDPFAGVGTTGVVCKELNRRFKGFELNEQYCNIANERLKGEDLIDYCD